MLTPGNADPRGADETTPAQTPAVQGRGDTGQDPQPASRVMVVCPSCKATVGVKRKYAGKKVRCKQCDHELMVPAGLDSPGTPAEGASSTSTSHSPQVESTATKYGSTDEKSLLSQVGQLLARHDELASAYDQ